MSAGEAVTPLQVGGEAAVVTSGSYPTRVEPVTIVRETKTQWRCSDGRSYLKDNGDSVGSRGNVWSTSRTQLLPLDSPRAVSAFAEVADDRERGLVRKAVDAWISSPKDTGLAQTAGNLLLAYVDWKAAQ